MPPGSAASLVASSSAAVASVVELFGVTVVTLQGRIDESFEGPALGGSLTGTILIDMANVERITSFGVREWLEMMATLDAADETEAYLARCSEAVVTQLSLIRAFAGRAKVVSFEVPFLCDDCGNAFVRPIDCTDDAAVILGTEPLMSACERCGGNAKLDDDPAYLAFAAPFAGQAVPERVRGVLQRIIEASSSGGDAVDKVITASETRVRVHRDVDPAFRWSRVLDGIEGDVVVDFRGAPRFGREAAGRLARAMRALGPEVTTCEIVECPVEVAIALGGSRGRIRIGSLAFEGRCASCAAARTGTVGLAALEASYHARGAPFVPCRRCNGPLVLGDISQAMNALFGGALPLSAAGSASTSSLSAMVASAMVATNAPDAPQPSPSSVAVASAMPASRARGARAGLALGVVALAVLAAAGLALTRRTSEVKVTPYASPLTPLAASPASPPDGVRAADGVVRGADGIVATITARAPDEDRALSDARAEAIARMLDLLELDLAASVRAANEASAARSSRPDAIARFVEQVGAIASPDRIDVARRAEAASVALTVTYRIGVQAWERAAAFYSEERGAGGITFAVAFPTRGGGLVVVASVPPMSAELPVGAIVEEIDGRRATSLDALTSVRRGAHLVSGWRRGERFRAKINVK